MDFKQLFQKYTHKVKSLWTNLKSHHYTEKAKSIWSTGKIQKSSRISYDVIWSVLLFFVVIAVIGGIFAGGVGAGYFASLVKDEPVRNYESMETDIYNYEETSSLYFAGEKYIGDIRSDIYREEVSLDNVSDVLKDAVIATEDEYFNKHEGIVPKAIVRAMVQQVTNSSTQSGGSTLTQQLVKNQILTNEVSFERKAKEILIALRLERFFEKDEILEAYLNIVPYGRDASGGNIAGIQTAAQGIFGIDASEANLAQAAYLAGLPQSPSAYTPFKNSGGLKSQEGLKPGINRMHSVLNRMYESDYISKEEYDKAMAYDITADFAEESQSPMDKYPYLTFETEDRASDIIMKHLAEEDGYSMEDLNNDDGLKEEYSMLADRALRQNGYQIHTTIDKETHDAFKETAQNYEYYGPDRTGYAEDPETGEQVEVTQPVQTGGILIENSSGRIISFVGGRNYNQDNQFNYATQAERSNGSTMKPILSYAPAFEKGVIQPGTPIADIPKTFAGGYTPGNYGSGYHGIVPARKALYNSYNIPAVDVYSRFYQQDAVSEFLEPMGITSIGDKEYANLSLALGATSTGVTVEENVNAFSTLGNNGKFADGYMIEKITDQDGNVIYEHKPDPVNVFSPETSYLTLDIMRDVIDQGTGAYVNSQIKHSGVDWAGKTGTSQKYKDAWFVGVNPNVSMGVWLGYEEGKSIRCPSCSLSYSQRTQKLWAELINAASDINPDLVAPDKNFERPDGIVSRSYCAISGMLPSDLCKEAGLVQTDLFNAKYVPTEVDDSLISGGSYVTVDGKSVQAGSKTPQEFVEGDGLTFNPEFLERKGYDQLSDLSMLFPRTNRGAWENIGLPQSDISSSSIEDDGENPAAPGDVSSSGNTLSWSSSGSNDTVGYRIYSAGSTDGSFSRVGSTTGTSFTAPNNNAVYHVKTVDYFGLESSASNVVEVGNASGSEDNSEEDNDDSGGDSGSEDNSESNNDNGNSEENNNNNNNEEDNENGGSGSDDTDSDSNSDGSTEDDNGNGSSESGGGGGGSGDGDSEGDNDGSNNSEAGDNSSDSNN
ncbi:transglycosylase domain-containing protein [Lentibacillus amyloliquefaciens]|uniref:Penicillin-binding protein n=1 Tax=Lentibacillus amyloliquefaciens TaxID=1472767 RepID=A0A0U4DSR8_9BACI|nr:transglycosylase domain-containing protein [Lentibacillus amyloliquefaciens]ALX48376.1 penicillin-binding protein [Lentibacillus amyloliquefaciens]